jgi:quercetin dioxygenase-like cupin family protein
VKGRRDEVDEYSIRDDRLGRIPASEHHGERGVAIWRTLQYGDVRIRIVEYSPGYVADHWCAKGHVVYCLEGELLTELRDGRAFVLRPGVSYQVADGETPHRSSTAAGARVFIVD